MHFPENSLLNDIFIDRHYTAHKPGLSKQKERPLLNHFFAFFIQHSQIGDQLC